MPILFPAPCTQARGIERLAQEAESLLEKREVEYLSIEARSVLNRCSSLRMPFTWTINPYRGCEFGCRYCYARYTHEFMGLDRLLTIMAQARNLRLSITTKSDLVTRDIDLLRRVAERNCLQVNLTVTTLDRRLARILEFRAPTPESRLAALRALREAGIVAGITISPILPDITDSPENLEALIAAAQAHGATHVFANVLFLKPSAQQAFFPFLEKHFPHLRKRYAARFARSAFLDLSYKEHIFHLVAELKRQHGFPDGPAFDMPAALHEDESEQLSLLQVDQSRTTPGRNAQQPQISQIPQIPTDKSRPKGDCWPGRRHRV